MIIIKSKLLENFSEIRFGFSGKFGLGRKEPYRFNMSSSVEDNRKIINENRKAFLNELDLDINKLAWQEQIHTDKIKIVKKIGFQGKSDALITNIRGISLGVFSADCATIYLFDKKEKIIAAVHSGWRGTARKILPKVIELFYNKFSSKPWNIYAYIAPAISQQNYEVDFETARHFASEYLIPKPNGKFLLDVTGINRDFLSEAGIPNSNIEVSRLCSFSSEFLHSYRRDGKISGRAMGVISLL